MRVLTEDLVCALTYAISSREKQEKELGFTGDSALVSGWKSLRSELYKKNDPDLNEKHEYTVVK